MSSAFLVALAKPFFMLVVFGLILLPIRLAVQRWWPDGRVKRFLLRKYW